MGNPDDLRTLSRGLSVLRALDVETGRSLAELHSVTGLAKPTLLRVLRTLEANGFARRRLADRQYRAVVQPTAPPVGLKKSLLAEVAAPHLDRLCQQILWPSDLAVYENGFMQVQETTRRRSPLILNREILHRRIDMFHSGLGRAYLAFVGDAARRRILRDVSQTRVQMLGGTRLEAMLETVRRDGYGTRDASFYRRRPLEERLRAIAVPIVVEGEAVAAVNIVWIVSAASEAQMVRDYLPPLNAAAAAVAQEFSERGERVLYE